MSSVSLAALVFACVFGGTIAALFFKRLLPEHHLNPESRDVVKLGMGLIATLAALVLGLLIATAKSTYDSQSGLVNELAANYLLLDRILARYGAETKDNRELLKAAATNTLERIWPADSQPADLTPTSNSKNTMENLYDRVAEITPKTEAQRELRTRALGVIVDIGQARLRLFSRQNTSLPAPFLVVLVFWLMILFVGYGLLAPGNATVLFILTVCAVSVAGAIFLMMELATPFAGVMRVSNAPLQHAVSLLGQN